jgi:PAS domain S-box-containing protein
MQIEVHDVVAAIESGQVVPCFQPLVELRSGQLLGFEVLARWEHPTLGFILPPQFIPLAEEHGLLDLLTQQILAQAFKSSALLPPTTILAMNITPKQLHDLDLPNRIAAEASSVGFSLARLKVEITETALLDDLPRARTVACLLKELGCKLALDDFGTGYSNLRHLQALPFDELKVDGSFVTRITKDRESRKIVAAILGLAHSLALTSVAEWVETEEQADMLRWLGCQVGQGWLFGKAVLERDIATLAATAPHEFLKGFAAPGADWAVSSLEALPTQRLAQLQAIYDGAPVGLCFVDRNLRYVSINRRLAEMNGASIGEHLGRTVAEMIPESYPRLEPYLLRALQGDVITDVAVERPSNKPGVRDWTALLSYQPALDEADEVIGLSIAVVDISELRKAQDSLRDIEERQSDSPISPPQAPWEMDNLGNSLSTSASWVRSIRHDRGEVRNLGWLEAVHPDDLEVVMRTMKDSLRTGRPIDIEYRVAVDERWRWMRSRGSPRFGPSNEILRWYGSVEDIDNQKLERTLTKPSS